MWKDSFLIGDDTVDNQHQELFKAVGVLRDKLKNSDMPDFKAQLVDTLAFLKAYCLQHFKDEEAYQLSVGFLGYEEHKKIHEKLVASVLDYERQLVDTDFAMPVLKGFLGFLAAWLVYHVAGEDQQIPKGARKVRVDGAGSLVQEFAAAVENVFTIFTGLSSQDMIPMIDSGKHVDAGMGFTVGLIGAPHHNGVGIAYSKAFSKAVVKQMMGGGLEDYNEAMLSAMQEITNIVSGNIAEVLSENAPVNVDIETPKQVNIDEIPGMEHSFIMHTKLGDVEVVVY